MSHIRIAAEEAFAPPELLDRYRQLLEGGFDGAARARRARAILGFSPSP